MVISVSHSCLDASAQGFNSEDSEAIADSAFQTRCPLQAFIVHDQQAYLAAVWISVSSVERGVVARYNPKFLPAVT